MRPCAFKWQSALHSALKEQFMSHMLKSSSPFYLMINGYILIFGYLSHRERLFVTVIMTLLEKIPFPDLDVLRWVIGCLSQTQTRTDQNAGLCFALVLDLHAANLMTQEFFSCSRLFFQRKPILLHANSLVKYNDKGRYSLPPL